LTFFVTNIWFLDGFQIVLGGKANMWVYAKN